MILMAAPTNSVMLVAGLIVLLNTVETGRFRKMHFAFYASCGPQHVVEACRGAVFIPSHLRTPCFIRELPHALLPMYACIDSVL